MTDLLGRIGSARRRLVEQGPPRTRDIEGDFQRISVAEDDCNLLRDLLLDERASTVIEVGLGYGSSALAIGEALITNAADSAQHIVVDPYQTTVFEDAGWQVICEAGLKGICTFIAERSQVVLPRLVTEEVAADAAFVDGSHLFHNVFVDLYFLGQIVRPGGLVILDDCDRPSVATATRYYELNMGWQSLPGPDRERRGHDTADVARLRAFRLPDPPLQDSFEDFKPFG